jgi:hypothetical protein
LPWAGAFGSLPRLRWCHMLVIREVYSSKPREASQLQGGHVHRRSSRWHLGRAGLTLGGVAARVFTGLRAPEGMHGSHFADASDDNPVSAYAASSPAWFHSQDRGLPSNPALQRTPFGRR